MYISNTVEIHSNTFLPVKIPTMFYTFPQRNKIEEETERNSIISRYGKQWK